MEALRLAANALNVVVFFLLSRLPALVYFSFSTGLVGTMSGWARGKAVAHKLVEHEINKFCVCVGVCE